MCQAPPRKRGEALWCAHLLGCPVPLPPIVGEAEGAGAAHPGGGEAFSPTAYRDGAEGYGLAPVVAVDGDVDIDNMLLAKIWLCTVFSP